MKSPNPPQGVPREAHLQRMRAADPSSRTGGATAFAASRVTEWALACIHLGVFVATYSLSFGIRFDFAVPLPMWDLLWLSLPWVAALKFGTFFAFGAYRSDWRFTTFSDLGSLIGASTTAAISLFLVDQLFLSNLHLPRSVLLIDWALGIVTLGGVRSLARFAREHKAMRSSKSNVARVVLVGADDRALALDRLIRSTQTHRRLVGFLEIGRSSRRGRLLNLPVVSQLRALAPFDELLVPDGSVQGRDLRHLLDEASQLDIAVKIVPAVEALLDDEAHVKTREVEIKDLLRRDAVELNREELAHTLASRAVMVTGAAGSIGSEIVRQLVKLRPSKLILVDQTELGLFSLEQELLAAGVVDLQIYIGDIVDEARLRQIFTEQQPEVVFHAAAYKHVPMMEGNPGEAVRNNIVGTRRVADLAHEFSVDRFVLVSTDKAVNPSSVMGTSKWFAERYVEALGQESDTRFVTVRFGNVLGSSGSVVEIFREQIKRGGPITLTHNDVSRFFMTIPEAAQLVLQASAMGTRGEIFVLEMGEPVRVSELARDMIRLSGIPDNQIEIQVTGLRPGERMHEQLYSQDEKVLPTNHPSVRLVQRTAASLVEARSDVDALAALIYSPRERLSKELLSSQQARRTHEEPNARIRSAG